jgi:hypothetical protein
VTDGVKFRHDISIQVEPALGWGQELAGVGLAVQEEVIGALEESGFL